MTRTPRVTGRRAAWDTLRAWDTGHAARGETGWRRYAGARVTGYAPRAHLTGFVATAYVYSEIRARGTVLGAIYATG